MRLIKQLPDSGDNIRAQCVESIEIQETLRGLTFDRGCSFAKFFIVAIVRQKIANMRLSVLLSLQLSHMILKIHTFCAVLGCQNRQK